MMRQKRIPQFHIEEFKRLLARVTCGCDDFYHCSPETVSRIRMILESKYRGKNDDLEYLMDMVNYQMRISGYTGPKTRYPVSRHLDRICKDPLYLDNK